MKILMISGVSYTVIMFRRELIKFLQDKGNEIIVVCGDAERKEEIEALGVEFYSVQMINRSLNPFASLAYKNKLSKLIKEVAPNIVMTFQAKPNTFGVLAAKKAGIKNIHCMVEGLGSGFSKSGVKGKLIKFISTRIFRKSFKNAKTVFFLNESNMQYMINNKITTVEQSYLINGIGIDLQEYSLSEMPPLESINFIMIARLYKEKGIVEYCEACKILKDKGIQNATFSLLGDSGDADEIVKEYAKKGYISFDGFVKDVRPILKQKHILVLPSYYNEGLPRSIMEAMSLGKVILTTDMPGCKETIVDGYNGLLVKVKNSQDLANKMEYLINNPTVLEQMGKNSRKLCEEKFDCNKINMQIWERLYE